MATRKQKFLAYWRNAPIDNPREIPWSGISQVQRDYDSLQEQAKIANFLSSVDEKLNLLKEKMIPSVTQKQVQQPTSH